MLRKPVVLITLIAIVSTLALSGCRVKKPGTPAKDYSGIELNYYKVFDDEDVIQPYISKFEASHPGLKINYKKFSDFSEYQQLVLNELADGEGPDIFSMQNTWFTSNYKKIVPMPGGYGGVEGFADTFVDVAYKDLVRPDENNVEQVYGLPMTVDTLALYYNKDQFEDALPERGKPSDTWEGIKDDVAQLNKEDTSFDRFEVSGIAMGRADNISRAVDILYMLFLQYGVDFYNKDISAATFAQLDSFLSDFPAENAVELYTSFADPKQKNYSWNEFTVDDDSPEQEIEAFVRGDVSMIIGYAYTYDLIMNQMNVLRNDGVKVIDADAVKVAPIPQVYDPDTSSEKRVAYASYFAEAVSRNSEHPDLAWEFLVFLSEKDNLEDYFNDTNKPTSRRDLIEKQKKDPTFGVFASQAGYAESFPIVDFYRYEEIFSDLIFKVNGGANIANALGSAQKLINQMIPKAGIIPKQ